MSAALAPSREIDGIPVYYDPKLPGIAFARGCWPMKSIVVGPGWSHLSAPLQQAVLAHEAGHCRKFHFEIRLLLIPFACFEWAQAIARRQEFAADAFAVREGHGPAMIQLMLETLGAERLQSDFALAPTLDQIIERKMSPSAADRLRHISRVLQEQS